MLMSLHCTCPKYFFKAVAQIAMQVFFLLSSHLVVREDVSLEEKIKQDYV
jgi:hypothetical protein